MSNSDKTALVAMSGGVDSSVAAALLLDQGYQVTGITMRLWDFEYVGGNINIEGQCCGTESFNDARKVCESFGIKHYVVNLCDEFKENVINNFVEEYLAGRTPNPCIRCNTKMKWGFLADKMKEYKADYLATGHYAQCLYDEKSDRYKLYRATNHTKDQSYALWGLSQSSLAKTLFPLGKFSKSEVREMALKYNLPTAGKSESQEICFIPDNNYHGLIEKLIPDFKTNFKKGQMVDVNGAFIGEHQGYPFYTIGQRKGLGGGFEEPMYVVGIDADKNKITIGNKNALNSKVFIVDNVNLISIRKIESNIRADIKIRYNDKGHAGTIYPNGSSQIRVEFDESQKAITPGQSAVFYDGDIVIGGGIIKQRLG